MLKTLFKILSNPISRDAKGMEYKKGSISHDAKGMEYKKREYYIALTPLGY